uniref:DNA 5'-3' helicase n=1 Tax=Antithamnionella ternifolia TaxID=207919 RepID=A0A4D6WL02_9FLOR|nr:replication helicase subunit [Antithamnionella ternifolia]
MLPIPPQNYLAEEILLGCILINPYIFPDIISTIKVESFFLECNQLIYINFIVVYKLNKLHPIEVLYHLSETKSLYKIGGIKKIIELMKQSQVFISSNNLKIYVNELVHLINNNYIKRLIIQYGYNIIKLGYIQKFASHLLYNKASQYLNITVEKIPKENFENLHTLIGNFILNLKSCKKPLINDNTTSISTIKSGFQNLDNLTNGLPNGELIIIAARPSTGKTSLAINITYNILKNSEYGICIFSLEMSSQQILNKLIAMYSKILPSSLANHIINKREWQEIQKTCKKLLKSPLHIHDKPNISIDNIEYLSKLWIQENKIIKLIIIDYLQLINTENMYNVGRVQELSHITRKLKLLAQYLNIPIITLSQLNRSIELRVNKKPILSDLRESGCLSTDVKINIIKNNNRLININSLTQVSKQQYNERIYLSINNYNYNHKVSNIYYKLKHIFCNTLYKNTKLKLTDNHKCLINNTWKQNNNILDNNTFTINYIHTKDKQYLEYKYVNKIKYKAYSYTYDITINNCFNLFCNHAILHNSIEQDADIIMMLYEKNQENKDIYINNTKIIDIILSKNRNGPTGSCSLIFSLDTNFFNG